jgi:hypothetical protein
MMGSKIMHRLLVAHLTSLGYAGMPSQFFPRWVYYEHGASLVDSLDALNEALDLGAALTPPGFAYPVHPGAVLDDHQLSNDNKPVVKRGRKPRKVNNTLLNVIPFTEEEFQAESLGEERASEWANERSD